MNYFSSASSAPMFGRRTVFLSLVGLFAGLLVIAGPLANAWVTHQNASNVIGEPDAATTTGGAGLNQLNSTYGVTVDAVSGKVFVSDGNNNRVLRFTSAAAQANGGTAEAAFSTAGASSLNIPTGITVDSSGNLWVADLNNNRVLRFPGAATLASGSSADVVLGQPNLASNAASAAANGMSAATGLFADSTGRLWVADQLNNRVLRFDNVASKASGANADGVLGQSGFGLNGAVTTQTGMFTPVAVTVDSSGRLWVAEAGNNRVLRFDNAASLGNGAPANGVLGQPNFFTNAATLSQAGMNIAGGVATDLAGRLYVTDEANNRILIFYGAATLPNGSNATKVLGQPDFTSGTANNGGVSASTLNNPRRLFFSEATQSLYAADLSNNRVLRFVPAGPTAAGVTVSGRVMTSDGRGLRNATVVLIDEAGNAQRVRTGSLGSYQFAAVGVGQTYVIAIESNTYRYSPRLISLDNAMANLDFVPTANARGKAPTQSAPGVVRPSPTRH